MIQAIVFDFDGLIFDTETAEFEAYSELYREHGQELSLKLWAECIGTYPSPFDPYEELQKLVGSPLDIDQLRIQRIAHFERRIGSKTLRPGVLDYLQTAKKLGIRIGLASSSTREWVTGYLRQFEIIDYFECIRTRDDVEKVKPDPALYLQAAACLGVKPENAVAFEDSPKGAQAAERAGLHCVIVPNDTTREFVFGKHDLRLNSMADLPFEELIAQINAQG